MVNGQKKLYIMVNYSPFEWYKLQCTLKIKLAASQFEWVFKIYLFGLPVQKIYDIYWRLDIEWI